MRFKRSLREMVLQNLLTRLWEGESILLNIYWVQVVMCQALYSML